MSNKLICPFCQQELHKDPDGYYSCYTDNCSVMNAGGNGASGTESLWTALTQAKQDLKIVVDALKPFADRDNWDFEHCFVDNPQLLAGTALEQTDHKEI